MLYITFSLYLRILSGLVADNVIANKAVSNSDTDHSNSLF